MKKCKILTVLTLLFTCIMFLNLNVYASTLEVINDNAQNVLASKEIKFTKKIINYDRYNKEAEIELHIENLNKIEQYEENVEIVILLDNSGSMSSVENNSTRKNTTYMATYKLVEKLYNSISNLKVGLVHYGDKPVVLSNLVDSKDKLINSLETYRMSGYGGGTETAGALAKVQSMFSKECKNKIIVLFTDGFPNNQNTTKQRLEAIGNSDISIISTIICKKANIQQIKNVFGTEENPTAGKLYYIEKDSEIERVFCEFTFDQIMTYLGHEITDVTIEDVFPDNILQYYDVIHSNVPSKGNIERQQDSNKFIWRIDELIGREGATYKYTIKLKENIDEIPIIDLEMDTNKTVNIKYKNEYKQEVRQILDKQPIIKLNEELQCYTVINDTADCEIQPIKNSDAEEEVITVLSVDIPIPEEPETPPVEEKTPEPPQTVQPPQTIQVVEQKPIQTERLPQTGPLDEIIIGISIIVSIILAIKMKLATKDIFIVRDKKNKF